MDENKWEDQAWMVFFLCDKDVRDHWNRLLNDDMVSASAEQVLELWQQLLQMQENQVVSVLFQYLTPRNKCKTKVLLFTQENDYLLVCNGIGSENLIVVTYNDMIDFCDWWSNLGAVNIPLTNVHPVYRKVFRCDLNVKTVHLFTETHDMVKNTNLRLAQFNMICEAASRKDLLRGQKTVRPSAQGVQVQKDAQKVLQAHVVQEQF